MARQSTLVPRSRRWVNLVPEAHWPNSAGVGVADPRRMQHRVELIAVGWMVVVMVADLLLSGVALVGLVNLSTFLVSAVSSLRRTAGFAIAGATLAVLAPLWDPGETTARQTLRVLDAVLVGVLALVLTMVRQRREQQLLRVVAAAEAAQSAILPTLPAHAGRVGVAARYRSAADEAMIGGDVYDMFYDDTGRVIAVVGDVAGHGLGSVREGARLIRAFRQYAPTSQTLTQLAAHMNAYLTPFLAPETFVTAILANVSLGDHFMVASCGHPAPLLMTRSGLVEVTVTPGPPLGLGGATTEHSIHWEPGDRLLLHTDGLFEARDRTGRFLRAAQIQPGLCMGTPDDALDNIIDTLETHVGSRPITDDVCLMLLENRTS
jgi:phosphoserine phosphatase RsbU/P